VQWTRSQTIRTLAEIPIVVDLFEPTPTPIYKEIAAKALELRHRGLSNRAIGRELGADPQTIAKGINWFESEGSNPRSRRS
jgi:hypothetical protein